MPLAKLVTVSQRKDEALYFQSWQGLPLFGYCETHLFKLDSKLHERIPIIKRNDAVDLHILL